MNSMSLSINKKRSLIAQVTFLLTIRMNAHIHEDEYLNITHHK